MKFVFPLILLSVVFSFGCGSRPDTAVIQAPEVSEEERLRQMEEYEKQMSSDGN
jgi:hypothetical protein